MHRSPVIRQGGNRESKSSRLPWPSIPMSWCSSRWI